MDALDWAAEFAQIISCTRCDKFTCRNILRDTEENVPQPGFIGKRFQDKRILLVGQNPGVPNNNLAFRDRSYTAALRHVRDQKSVDSWVQLQEVLSNFIPSWPVHGNYFPLHQSGLTLDEIAYCNIARCRTERNTPPSLRMAWNCADSHFARWLDLLKPRAIVFVGKWPYNQGAHLANVRHIPCDFMDRNRSLSSTGRIENRQRVAAFVRAITG